LLNPAAKHGRRNAKKKDGKREDPTELGELPVVRRGLGDTEQPSHRQIQYTEGVGLTDAQVHAQRGWRHHLPAETGLRDRAIWIKKSNS
jgi:hypothetical protein